MIDAFVLLAPLLLLGVIALVRFIGCNQVFGIDPTTLAMKVVSIVPVSGSPEGGTAVTIGGTGFVGGASVRFDQTDADPASVTVVDGNTIMALTPAHPTGLVDVTVTNPDNNGDTLSQAYFYSAVTNLKTVIQPGGTGITSLSAPVPDLGTGKLVVVTVQWGGAATVTLSGGPTFTSLGMDSFNPHRAETFVANGVGTPITVTATLSTASSTMWNLAVTVYDFADTMALPDQPARATGTGANLSLPYQTNQLSPGDLIYAVAVSRNSGFVLAGSLSAGSNPNFVAEAGQGSYLMVEDYVLQAADIAAGQINVSGVDSDSAARWYLFAAHIRHL